MTQQKKRQRMYRLSGGLVAAAALVAAGVTSGTAGAAPADNSGTLRAGALPAQVSATQHKALMEKADSPSAKAADARALGLGEKETLHVKGVVKNKSGATHVRYERTYDGLPVIGGDLVVHKSSSGDRTGVSRGTEARIAVDTTDAPATKKPATAQAEGSVAPKKVVFAAEGKPVLAWERVVGGTQKDGTPNRLHVITDAKTGEKLLEYQGVHTGTGQSQYSGEVELSTSGSEGSYTLSDTGRGDSRTTDLENGESGEGKEFTDEDDKWGTGSPDDAQTAGVDAHYGAALTWDYFASVHNREGIAGDGKGAVSRVHYGDGYQNAFWEDGCFCMTYGDGEGNKKPLTSVDVTAHEMSHGVTSTTAGLIYQGESGGLNEATSDIFAAGVEFQADNGTDVPDYLVGEAIDLHGNGEPLRHMDEPSKDGSSLDYWDENAGNEDVHHSSGIANHFFYLLSEGSGAKEINGVQYDSPTADGSEVTGIGIEKAEQIWFKALTENMTSTTDYAAAREATVQAAGDLYGADSTEAKTVAAAWTAVSVD